MKMNMVFQKIMVDDLNSNFSKDKNLKCDVEKKQYF